MGYQMPDQGIPDAGPGDTRCQTGGYQMGGYGILGVDTPHPEAILQIFAELDPKSLIVKKD